MRSSQSWLVPHATTPVRSRVVVPASASTHAVEPYVAATFAAAGLVTGGTVLIRNWPEGTPCADTAATTFADMGGYVISSASGLTVTGRATGGHVHAVDIAGCDDTLAPLFIVLASLADDAEQMVAPETTSARLTLENLENLPSGGPWEARGRCEVALAGLVLGLVRDGIEITDWDVAEICHPGLSTEWVRMLAADEYLVPGSALLPHEYLRSR